MSHPAERLTLTIHAVHAHRSPTEQNPGRALTATRNTLGEY